MKETRDFIEDKLIKDPKQSAVEAIDIWKKATNRF
jgi:hypothetical protein